MRMLAKGNLFYIKDKSFLQINRWLGEESDKIITKITTWATEAYENMKFEDPPEVDEQMEKQALNNLYNFMLTKATSFSHALAEERTSQVSNRKSTQNL
jgi:hypothetical protein